MSCVFCDHTLQRVDHGPLEGPKVFWCPRCGAISSTTGFATAPKLVERCRMFEKQPLPATDRRAVGDVWRALGIAESINLPENRR